MDEIGLINSRRAWAAGGLVIAAATFNMGLCFLNTYGLQISKTNVITSEVVIYIVAALMIFRTISLAACVFAAVFLAYIAAIWLVSGSVESKVVRDLFIIPFLFILCGTASAGPREADRLVYLLILLVFAVAIWEWFWLDQFLKSFDIIKYYIARGSITKSQIFSNIDVALNGVRSNAEGRSLFPALGPHRVSSIFLEPTSVGYFSVITFSWLLVRFWGAPLKNLTYMALVFVLITFSDSRAGATMCIALVIVRMLPPTPAVILWLLPFGVLAGIAGLGAQSPHLHAAGLTFSQRLAWSGQLVAGFDFSQWFGIGQRTEKGWVDTDDSGFAYLIYAIGIVGMVFLWTAFCFARDRTLDAGRYRTLLGIYLALTLSVSPGVFSIKTAALAWFLLGAAQNLESRRVPLGLLRGAGAGLPLSTGLARSGPSRWRDEPDFP